MMSFTRRLLAGLFSAFLSLSTFAALPESGMWAIGDEVNGKPGRGIQVDNQGGKFLIFTYFGYRADGTATFMQSSGQLQNGKDFNGDLVEYKNGRVLGGSSRDGETARVIGPISVTFESATKGVISLPGEPPQKLSRYRYEDTRKRLDHYFSVSSVWDRFSVIGRGGMRFASSADTLAMDHTFNDGKTVCKHLGNLVQVGNGFESEGSVSCDSFDFPPRYRIENLLVNEFGLLSGHIVYLNADGTFNRGSDIMGVCERGGPIFLAPERCWPSQLGLD
jgi:hypothetical protein